MDLTLTPDALLALTLVNEMIDSRRWGAKARIFTYLARRQIVEPDGVTVSYRSVASTLGIEERWAARLLKAMVADRILELVQPGKGKRASCYRINPNVDHWRNVALTIPVEAAMWRIRNAGLGQARHLVRLFPELGIRNEPGQGPAISHYFLRSHNPALAESLDGLQRSTSDLDNPQIGQLLDTIRSLAAALTGSQRGEHHVELQEFAAAIDSIAADRAPSLLERAPLSPQEREREVAAPGRSAVLAAITKASDGALWGRPIERLDELLRCVPAEELVAWCEEERAARRSGRPLGPLALLAVLEARAGGATQAESVSAPVRLVANLRSQVLGLLEDGDEDSALLRLSELRSVDADAAAELVDGHEHLRALVGD